MRIEEIKEQCVGCMACLNICPKNCIVAEYDDEGFYYPKINHKKCVNCGKCENVCSIINKNELEKLRITYYGKSKNKEVLIKSTSGGAFFHFAKKINETGGNVYAAYFDCKDYILKCKSSDEVGLNALLKSKYIENQMFDAIRRIQNDLIAGRKVLFCGTPCEVSGVRKSCGKYENLILVDFICHGVPSSKIFKEHLEKVKPKGYLTEVDFRPKDVAWDGKNIKLKTKTKTKTKTTPYYLDSFYSGFMTYNAFLRKACYNCEFRKNHFSDITIADFWGYKQLGISYEEAKEGLSLIIANTDKGNNFIKSINDEFDLNRIDNCYSDYVFQNRDYKKAYQLRGEFYELYHKKGFEYAAKHTYMKGIFNKKLKYKIKNLLGIE